jgi:hypothetical protein
MNIPDPNHLRQLIEATLADLGLAGTNWSCVTSPLQGRHRPEMARNGILVVWFPERNSLEFYGEDGCVLRTASVAPDSSRERAA